MQGSGRTAGVAAMLAVGLWASGCAAPHAARTGATAGGTAVGAGTIVAIRPPAPARTDLGGSILGALGAAADSANRQQAELQVEFIVRADSGQTVSVMQYNEKNLLPGDRVLLTRGDRIRLVHGAGPPAGA